MAQLPGPQGGKPRLIMVDDSRVMRKAASKMLGEKFDVVVAEDGQEGWNKIRHDEQIQVVFTDLSMPELDGYGLLEKIRTCEDPGIAGLPVIIVTGADNDDTAREKALEMGATDFITKPFNSTNLLARATAHANYQRERRELEQQTTIDALTGLGNKQHFSARLKQDLAFCERHGHPLSIVRFDIDGFNQLFIKAGKEAADSALKEVGRIIARIIRKEDTAARIGLAQYAISLPTAEEGGAAILANRILKTVRETEITLKGKRLPVTLSGGVIQPEPHPGQTPRSVMEEANVVLQAAVKAGGDQVVGSSSRTAKTKLPSTPRPPEEKTFPRAKEMGVDEALGLLAEGREEEVRPHLGELRRKLKPLMALVLPPEPPADRE
jgi:two-component system cell cycle response regulator